MEAVHSLTSAELLSADRGKRRSNAGMMDVIATLSLGDWKAAERLVRDKPELIKPGGVAAGALHLMAKRNDAAGVKWLLEHAANPNVRWAHWNAEVTPLHLAAMQGHGEVARLLLEAGADPSIRDSAHDSDPVGWAEFFQKPDVAQILKEHGAGTRDV